MDESAFARFAHPFDAPALPSDAVVLARAHVRSLADTYSLDWHEVDIALMDAEGDLGERWVRSPLIHTEIDYLVALHEVGHHVLRLPTEEQEGNVILANEIAAWGWAVANSLFPITERSWETCCFLFSTHGSPMPPQEAMREMQALHQITDI